MREPIQMSGFNDRNEDPGNTLLRVQCMVGKIHEDVHSTSTL
jgi:hypothetical protein